MADETRAYAMGEKSNFRREIFRPQPSLTELRRADSERERRNLANKIGFGTIANAANLKRTTDTGSSWKSYFSFVLAYWK